MKVRDSSTADCQRRVSGRSVGFSRFSGCFPALCGLSTVLSKAPRCGEMIETARCRFDIRPLCKSERQHGQSCSGELHGEGTDQFAVAVANEFERQCVQAGILADEHDMRMRGAGLLSTARSVEGWARYNASSETSSGAGGPRPASSKATVARVRTALEQSTRLGRNCSRRRYLAISGMALTPRLASGLSWSSRVGSAQLDLAWRRRERVNMRMTMLRSLRQSRAMKVLPTGRGPSRITWRSGSVRCSPSR